MGTVVEVSQHLAVQSDTGGAGSGTGSGSRLIAAGGNVERGVVVGVRVVLKNFSMDNNNETESTQQV